MHHAPQIKLHTTSVGQGLSRNCPVKVLTMVVSWAQTVHVLYHDSHSQHTQHSCVRVMTVDSDTCLFGKQYWHLPYNFPIQ